MPSLYRCSSNNFATIWLNHASSVITISSMWILFIFNMTVPIDESCIVLASCWSLVSISSDLEAQWNPGESINRLTMLKCTFQLTPVLLLIIPQSHRPNRHETDLKPTKKLKFGERSVYSRYWFGFVGLVSVYVRADKFVGERSFKHVCKISPRQIVGCLSVICRCGVGFVDNRLWRHIYI